MRLSSFRNDFHHWDSEVYASLYATAQLCYAFAGKRDQLPLHPEAFKKTSAKPQRFILT
ncbi:MAG: hypothetical protein AAF616_02750 [Bacteroidota bacterium]